jgi:hypothetical protein
MKRSAFAANLERRGLDLLLEPQTTYKLITDKLELEI